MSVLLLCCIEFHIPHDIFTPILWYYITFRTSLLCLYSERISHSVHVSFTPILAIEFYIPYMSVLLLYCDRIFTFRTYQFYAYTMIEFHIPHMSVFHLCHDGISHSACVSFTITKWNNFTFPTCHLSTYVVIEFHIPRMSLYVYAVKEFHIPYMSVLYLYLIEFHILYTSVLRLNCDRISHSIHVSFTPILW